MRNASDIIIAALAVAALVPADAAISPPDFARYNIILTSKPFGTAPPPVRHVVQTPPTPPAQPGFAKYMRVCFMRSTDDGLRVGIVDSKTQWSTVLSIGESSQDGIQLVDADYERGAALLQKGSEKQWIDINGETTATAPPPPTGPATGTPSSRTSRYSEILRRRREALEKQRQEAQQGQENTSSKPTGEELKKHLEEYNMELIRAGGEMGPALPIPLTKEQDDQLVAEGVLPPQE